jgi:hypothetical protein
MEITPGLITGIVFLIMLLGSFGFILMHKPGEIRRKDRVIDEE